MAGPQRLLGAFFIGGLKGEKSAVIDTILSRLCLLFEPS
jgi:hypothetical protein